MTDLQRQILKAMRFYGRVYTADYLAKKLGRSKSGISNSIRGISPHLIVKSDNGYEKPIMITCYKIS